MYNWTDAFYLANICIEKSLNKGTWYTTTIANCTVLPCDTSYFHNTNYKLVFTKEEFLKL